MEKMELFEFILYHKKPLQINALLDNGDINMDLNKEDAVFYSFFNFFRIGQFDKSKILIRA